MVVVCVRVYMQERHQDIADFGYRYVGRGNKVPYAVSTQHHVILQTSRTHNILYSTTIQNTAQYLTTLHYT